MHKIVAAVNSMIGNSSLISHVIKSDEELFFIYDEKFKWSISKKDGGEFFMHYYPGQQTLEQLAFHTNWGEFNDFITYSTRDIKTKEARESFGELYQTVQTKLYGIDDVLDYIINTAA
jgi:hypothetical protein